MGENNLLYEDAITISSWRKSVPFIILGFLVMVLVYIIMPFPVVTIYDTAYNILFAISVGLVLVIIGIYFHLVYRKMRYGVTKESIIIEFGREKKIIPLNEVTSIRRKKSMTFGEKLKASTENIEKVLFATIRDTDIIQIYHSDSLAAIITPVDTDEFLTACNYKA